MCFLGLVNPLPKYLVNEAEIYNGRRKPPMIRALQEVAKIPGGPLRGTSVYKAVVSDSFFNIFLWTFDYSNLF